MLKKGYKYCVIKIKLRSSLFDSLFVRLGVTCKVGVREFGESIKITK